MAKRFDLKGLFVSFLQWASWKTADWARQLKGEFDPEFLPAQPLSVWGRLSENRTGISLMVEEAMKAALANRPRRGRNQKEDNERFAPLSTAINQSIMYGDISLAARVFRENYPTILDYEKQNPTCESHKGALAFDVARAYLQEWDFFAAIHYFELAQHETRLTDHNPLFTIYTFDLFEKNFWDSVGINTVKHPISIYQEFWGIPYDKRSALADYGELLPDIKLAYIIASAQRVRLQNIADHSSWEDSNALRLGYWTLAADLARLLEVEAKRRYMSATGSAAPDNTTIVPCLEGGFSNTALGNISRDLSDLQPTMFPRKPTPPATTPTPADLYEMYFDAMLARIRNSAVSRTERICTALYRLGFTRNQVAHKIDENSKLFKQLDDARFLVDLFLTLCHTNEWHPLQRS